MKNGLYCSIVMHLAMLILLIYGLPHLSTKANVDYAIVADVVPISEISNIKVRRTEKLMDDKKDIIKPKDTPKTIPPEPTAKVPSHEVKDEKAAEKVPDNTQKEKLVKKLDEKPIEKVPDKVIKEKPIDKKPPRVIKPNETKLKDKPVDKKLPTPEKNKKPNENEFEKNILKSLEKDVKKKDDSKKLDQQFADIEKLLQGDTNKDYNPNLPLSISEIDGIKSQIISKWNTASFSGSSEKGMFVVIHIELDMAGNVLSARPTSTNNSSPYYRSFVESALRAIKTASPLQNLDAQKFSTWKEIEFKFDSSGMVY